MTYKNKDQKSHIIPGPRNFMEVTRLPVYAKKGFIKRNFEKG